MENYKLQPVQGRTSLKYRLEGAHVFEPQMANSGGGGGMMKVSVVDLAAGEFNPIEDSAEIMLSNYPGGINIDVSCDGNPSSVFLQVAYW